MQLNHSSNSFTFIELLIVIIVIGILLGVSMPQVRRAHDNFVLETFVKNIYTLSRFLQSAAIVQAKVYYLNVDKANRAFFAEVSEDGALKEVKNRFAKKYKAPEGISVSMEPKDAAGIYFYPDGRTDNVTITVENRNQKKFRLIVKGAAGQIKIQ